MKRLFSATVAGLVFLACLWLLACDSPSRGAADANQPPLRRANTAEPATLDPHKAEGTPAFRVLRDLYEGLVTEAPDGSLVPGAAERWTISDDGLRYTFELRSDARWSNGDPVVAEDFAAGLRRAVAPATASPYAQTLLPIRNAAAIVAGEAEPESLGVRAVDERTLAIELDRPTPYLLGLLTNSVAFPLHRASYAEHGEQFVKPGTLIGNGAYRLERWRIGDRMVLIKNEYYHDAANVAVATVEYLPIEDTNTELNLFRAGELDIMSNTPNALYPTLATEFGERLIVHPLLGIYFYVFDLSEPPFDDVRVREAVTIAIDRDALSNIVLNTGQPGAWGLIPPGVDGYDSFSYAWQAWPRERQLALARERYAEAGFSDEQPLDIRLLYNTSDTHKKIAVAVQSMLRDNLGARVELENQEWKVVLDSRRDKSQWDLLRLGWNGDYNDPNTFLEIFRSGHPQNAAGFANADYDARLAAIAGELDPAVRMRAAREAEALLMREYPVLPLYFYVSKHLISERVEGFTPNIADHIYSRHLRLKAAP